MAGFIYFIPDVARPIANAKSIPPECNLGKVLDGAPITHGVTPRGPNGGMGTLFAVDGRRIYCDTAKQKWTEVKASEDGPVTHWIGWDNNDKPTPHDLMREKQIQGYPVEMGDGNEWVIPAVFEPASTLPRAYRYKDGNFITVPMPGYEDIVKEADKWIMIMAKVQEGVEPGYTNNDLLTYIVNLLALNYRVGPVECTCGTDYIMCTKAIIFGVLMASLGWPAVEKQQQEVSS